jgi:hypothetical protein
MRHGQTMLSPKDVLGLFRPLNPISRQNGSQAVTRIDSNASLRWTWRIPQDRRSLPSQDLALSWVPKLVGFQSYSYSRNGTAPSRPRSSNPGQAFRVMDR